MSSTKYWRPSSRKRKGLSSAFRSEEQSTSSFISPILTHSRLPVTGSNLVFTPRTAGGDDLWSRWRASLALRRSQAGFPAGLWIQVEYARLAYTIPDESENGTDIANTPPGGKSQSICGTCAVRACKARIQV